MQRLTVSINNQEVEFIIVEAGEKAKAIREELNLDISDVAGISWLKDDDFEYDYPLSAEALKNAGVDFTTINAVMELK
jgi:hypothetical protein